MKVLGKYKNGNYNVTILNDGTKIRETEDNEFIPEFSENCDIKITDKCDGGCKFCYENCTENGKHGNLNYEFFNTLHPYTEIAINGNDLSHPELVGFLLRMKYKKVIVNMTINQMHFEKHEDFIHRLVKNKLIHGLGVSLRNPTNEFISKIKKYPNAVIHVINGIFDKNDFDVLKNNNLKLLILGYKNLRRGEDYHNSHIQEILYNQKWLYDNIGEFIKSFNVVSFDNLGIEQLELKRLFTEEEWEEFYMGNDGEFTFYIDLVEGVFAKNSLSMERYPIMDNIDDMFKVVLKNN